MEKQDNFAINKGGTNMITLQKQPATGAFLLGAVL
jgi:hypothetical protein